MITNIVLKKCNEQVFSYSSAYQVPFCGRENSIKEMKELNNNLNAGESIVISQPLGTGKTFLVNYMINSQQLEIPVGVSFLTARGIAEDARILEKFPGETLVVDEVDIKTTANNLKKGLAVLAEYLEESKRKAIILGDYTLKNKEISGCLEKQIPLLHFEDIDKNFLKKVLKERFKQFLSVEEDFEIEQVIEPELLDYLVPEWMKTTNSFRGIFSLLQEIVKNERYVRYNSNKAFLTVEMCRDVLWNDEEQYSDKNQKIFLEAFREYLKEVYPKGRGITRGFTESELYELACNSGLMLGIDDFRSDILDPFSSSDLLVATGIPRYEKGNRIFKRYTAPFIPSLKLMLQFHD